MASGYPGAIDSFATNKVDATLMVTDHAAVHNNLGDAMNKVQTELGVTPSGAAIDVASRFSNMDALATTHETRMGVGETTPRLLVDAMTNISNSDVAGFKYMADVLSVPWSKSSGDTLASTQMPRGLFYMDSTRWPVPAGKTRKMAVSATCFTNGTDPDSGGAVTIAFGLYPVTVSGGAGNMILTFGTVVAEVSRSSWTANAITHDTTSAFTAPANGAYILGYNVSASITLNARMWIAMKLEGWVE